MTCRGGVQGNLSVNKIIETAGSELEHREALEQIKIKCMTDCKKVIKEKIIS